MLQLNDVDSMFIDEKVAGLAKRLVDDGIVPRQVDLLLLGFGYAVRKRIEPLKKIKRHDLLRAGAVESNIRLAIETVAPWFARELRIDSPKNPRELLDFICRVGSAGIVALQKEWQGRSKSQIELSILQLASNATA